MPGHSLQKTAVALIIGLVLIVVAGITKGWFGPDKVEVTNFSTQKDTLLVRQVDGKKDTIIRNVPVIIRKGSQGDTTTRKSTILNAQQLSHDKVIAEVVNSSMNVRFAIIAITNGIRDNQLASVFVNWLQNYGSASNLVLLNSFIEGGFFKRIIEGESNAVLSTNASQAAEYICIVKASIDYSQKSAIDGFKLAAGTYDFLIIDTKSGQTVDSEFSHSENSSDISENKAKARTESFLSGYLLKRKLTI